MPNMLSKINMENDIKLLDHSECKILADEIRDLLIKRTSEIGGHLASNLGVVELTIALHRVFNSPKDKFIFDVSHQCYTHKILTGRKDAYMNKENYGMVNGYTNPDESKHDIFKVGHTATSISLAAGMAKARDLIGGTENIIAVIGDGSLSGGEALEGLNFVASELKGNFIIIFNDNQMSIAENHGGMYCNFELLRKTDGKAENNIFKAFGYDYRFVENGHDIGELEKVLNDVKNVQHPVLVHVCTTKGKGYRYAEENKESSHWVRPFYIENGEEKRPFNGERYDKIVRDYLMEKMQNDPSVVTIIAAVPDALSFTREFREKAGKQFIDVGIAEEHAVTMAAGVAKNGGKPVLATFSTFFQRTYDQIAQDLCINKCAATLIVANASVYAVNDITHIGIFDIPMMANIPELVYLAPTNKQEYLAMLEWSINQNEYPVAIRAPRNGIFYAKDEVDKDYGILNRFKITHYGSKIAVIALGDFYQMGEALVEKIYSTYNIDATLINPRYITGIDEILLNKISKNHSIVITLEDGILDGGFGEKIARFYGLNSMVKVMNYGLKKEFLDSYNVEEVLVKNHLKPDLIVEDIKSIW